MKDVVFEKLSSFQKKDCINRSEEYQCPNKATQEAVLGHDIYTSRIRCCRDPKCMARARELAFTGLGLKVPNQRER